MAVSVSRDLTVQVLEDVNAVKLTDRQQALRAAIQRGEPKSLGVSQVMLGLMVISYSIPLNFSDHTEVMWLCVPLWSGVTFITAGVFAIVLDKHGTMRLLQVCLGVSVVAVGVSVLALIIYSVDMGRNPTAPCKKIHLNKCDEMHYAMRLSRGVKSTLLLFTLVQTLVSSVLCFLLHRQRRCFGPYTSLNQPLPPTTSTPPGQD